MSLKYGNRFYLKLIKMADLASDILQKKIFFFCNIISRKKFIYEKQCNKLFRFKKKNSTRFKYIIIDFKLSIFVN